jgi:hypothetical protein
MTSYRRLKQKLASLESEINIIKADVLELALRPTSKVSDVLRMEAKMSIDLEQAMWFAGVPTSGGDHYRVNDDISRHITQEELYKARR